jgi:hypothetical protein
MKTTWTIQEELITLGRQWPLLTLAFLAGSLLGWLLTMLLPPTYRASAQLYVAFNGDVIVTTPDDYKNWQMRQLETFLVSEPVIAELREVLRTNVTGIDDNILQLLPRQLSIGWQNAGKWTLIAEDSRPEIAEAVAGAWVATALQQISTAQPHAEAVLQLERNLRIITNQRYIVRQRQAILAETRLALEVWQVRLDNAAEAAPLGELEHWRLLTLVSQAVGNDPAGNELIASAPDADAPLQDFAAWVARALVSMEQMNGAADALVTQLAEQESDLYAQWLAEEQAARGITTFLYVEPLAGGQVTLQQTRTAGMAAVVGGFCGLIAYLLFRLAWVSLRKTT